MDILSLLWVPLSGNRVLKEEIPIYPALRASEPKKVYILGMIQHTVDMTILDLLCTFFIHMHCLSSICLFVVYTYRYYRGSVKLCLLLCTFQTYGVQIGYYFLGLI